MTKKKADPHAESNPHKAQVMVDDDETIDNETAPQKLAKLKALNALLLKETVERRKQVDLLSKSNGNLKSELNQSVMDKGLLQSEMSVLTEKAVMLEIEKGLVPVYMNGQMNQQAEERFESLKERIGSLEGEMKRALEEKSEVENSKSEKESEIRDLNRRLDELLAKIEEERRVSSRVCDERDEIRSQLDAQIQEVKELQLKVTESEKTVAQISEEVMELKANLERSVEENIANKQLIDLITTEKNLIEENFVKSNDQIDVLKRNVDDLIEQKKAIEEEKNTHQRKNEELQTMTRELKDLIESMKIDEKELLDQITDLEKKRSTSSENEAILQTQVDGLVEERRETDKRIDSLETEKSSVLKDLQDTMKELEHQKLTIEQIVQEKTKLEDAKVQGESEILKMKQQFENFQDTITDLEKKYATSSENEIIKQNQINGLIEEKRERDERIESLEAEKSSVLKDLHDVMQELEHQKLTIEKIVEEKAELENAKIQGENEIVKMKEQLVTLQNTSSGNEVIKQNQIDNLIEEKKNRDEQIISLETEKNSVQKDLRDVMQELEHSKLLIEKIVQEKAELENEKVQGESEIVKLKEQLVTFQDTSSETEVKLQNEIAGLIEEKKQRDERIDSLETKNNSVLKNLNDVMQELEHQKLTIEKIVQEKTELENAKSQAEDEIAKMKEELITFQETISSLENSSIDQNQKVIQLEAAVNHYQLTIEQIVQEKTELENAKIQGESEIVKMKEQLVTYQDTSSETEVKLLNEIAGLIEEKKEKDERIESLEAKQSSVLKNLHDVMQELEHQKLTIEKIIQEKTELENANAQRENEIAKMKEDLITFQETISSLENSSIDQSQKVIQLEAAVNHYQLTIEQIVQEKTELENAKIQGDSEITKMKDQLITFQDTVSSFENSSTDQNQKLKQLEDQVNHYKSSFNQAQIQKDEALKSLQEQQATKTDLQHKITAMEKEIQDLHKNLSKTTTETVAEKAELEDRCSELTKTIAVLEAKLAEINVNFDETKVKLGLAEANSNRVLNTLKKTLSGGIETHDRDLGNGIDEEIKDRVTEVEEIKRAFKEKDIKVEEMKRELELVKSTAGKEKSFWTLVSSATTLLAAAVSVAYVARAN
ncbi:hypothetical protein LXL04_007613 [Taraxacum kok-saghyz]